MSALAVPTYEELPRELRALVLRFANAVGSDPIKDKVYLGTQLGQSAVKPYLSWKRNETGAAEATVVTYERRLNVLCLWCEERGITLETLTIDHFRQVRDLVPPPSRRHYTATFRDFSKFLYDENITSENLAGRLRYPKAIKPVITGLFDDDEKYEIVTAQTDIMDRVGVLLLLRSGIRQGELRNLTVRDVNLVEKYLLVRRGKGSKSRRIPIKGELVRALEQLMLTDVPGVNRPRALDEYLLCPTRGGKSKTRVPTKPMTKRGAHEWWYRCLSRAGIVEEGVTKGRRMHLSRHTYATDLGRATNWNMVAVSKNLGHSSIAITVDTYTDFAFEDQADAVAMLPEIGESSR